VRVDIGDPLDGVRSQHLTRCRTIDRHPHADRALGHAGACRDDEVGALAQQDHEAAGFDERAAALGDELEHLLELHLGADGDGDRARGLQAPPGLLELVAARRDGVIQARVLDRDRRPGREDHGRLLVDGVELAAALLLGQVEVAPHLPAHDRGYAEEARHRRMARREAIGLRVLADVRETQRPRTVDEHAEDATPARQVADRAMRLGVHPARDEALELAAIVIKDPECGVARAGDLARRLEHLVEHGFGVHLRQQAPADVDQAPQSLLAKMGSRVVVVAHLGLRSFWHAMVSPSAFRASASCRATAARRPAGARRRPHIPHPPWRRVALFQAWSVSACARLDGYGGRFQTWKPTLP